MQKSLKRSSGKILTPVELLMNVSQPLVGDVGVDLSRRDVFMAQKLLDTSKSLSEIILFSCKAFLA